MEGFVRVTSKLSPYQLSCFLLDSLAGYLIEQFDFFSTMVLPPQRLLRQKGGAKPFLPVMFYHPSRFSRISLPDLPTLLSSCM